jgi:hypothetical protein
MNFLTTTMNIYSKSLPSSKSNLNDGLKNTGSILSLLEQEDNRAKTRTLADKLKDFALGSKEIMTRKVKSVVKMPRKFTQSYTDLTTMATMNELDRCKYLCWMCGS